MNLNYLALGCLILCVLVYIVVANLFRNTHTALIILKSIHLQHEKLSREQWRFLTGYLTGLCMQGAFR